MLWKKLWAAEVPPKVHNFAWRSLKNVNSVNVNMSKRDIRADNICQRMWVGGRFNYSHAC